MNLPRTAIPLFVLALAACQEPDPSAEAAKRPVDAERIQDAAAQSDPASAAILDNAADNVVGNGVDTAQKALATAGNATQGAGTAMNGADATPNPLSLQAVPNRDGQERNFDENGKLQARPKFVPSNAQPAIR